MLNLIKKIFNKKIQLEHIDNYEEGLEKVFNTKIEKKKEHQAYTSTQTMENLEKMLFKIDEIEEKAEKKRAEEVTYYMERTEEEDDDYDYFYTSREMIDPEGYYSGDFWDVDRLFDMDNYYP